jgi:hypothetical protein
MLYGFYTDSVLKTAYLLCSQFKDIKMVHLYGPVNVFY